MNPCCFSPSSCNFSTVSKSRFCAYCRMAPALLALCMCITGVVISLMWNQPYLAIPFAAGVCASTYTFQLSYHYSLLKTYEENNTQLQSSVFNLNGEVTRATELNARMTAQYNALKAEHAKIAATAEKLEKTNHSLGSQVSTLKSENINLHAEVQTLTNLTASLGNTNKALEKSIKDFEEINRQQLNKITTFNEMLSKLEVTSTDQIGKLAAQLTLFSTHLGSLDRQNSAFKEHSGNMVAQMHERLAALSQTATLLGTAFQTVDKWLQPDAIQKQVAAMGEIQRQQQAIQLEHVKAQAEHEVRLKLLNAEISRHQQQLTALEGHISRLEKTRSAIEAAISKFYNQLETLGEHNTQLAGVASQLKGILGEKARSPLLNVALAETKV